MAKPADTVAAIGGAEALRRSVGPRANELALLFTQEENRIVALVRQALGSRLLSQKRFTRAQALEIREIVRRLRLIARTRTLELVEDAHKVGAIVGGAESDLFADPSTFGAINRQAVNLLAENLAKRLDAAAVSVGRRAEGVLRREALRAAGEQLISPKPELVQSKVLTNRLQHEGVTAFVDKTGRRWRLESYSRMALRTTQSEAVVQGTVAQMTSRGVFLAKVTDHNCRFHPNDPENPCRRLEGKTIDIRSTPLPPWHPMCEHLIFPAVEAFA
jgi:hypothetical protein